MLACILSAPALADKPDWYWQGSIAAGGEIELNLVRASVRVVQRAGPAIIEIEDRSGNGLARVALRVEETDRGIRVIDLYEPHSTLFRGECEAPDDERGDFLHSDVILDAVLYVAPGVGVSGHIMSRRKPLVIVAGDQSRSGAPPGKKER